MPSPDNLLPLPRSIQAAYNKDLRTWARWAVFTTSDLHLSAATRPGDAPEMFAQHWHSFAELLAADGWSMDDLHHAVASLRPCARVQPVLGRA